MEIIFVRHGETQHNKKHQLMGQRIDDPLDSEGLHQASALLAKLPTDATVIFSSPLKRALQTAEIISRHLNLPVNTDDLLRERDFGTLSGKTWEQINAETGQDLHVVDQKLEYDYRKFGGEAASQVKGRLMSFLEMLKKKYSKDKPIVVTHYGMIMLMDQMYQQKTHQSLGNVSVHKYRI